MLSIHFDDDHKWWVSGRVFERLFQSALKRGDLHPTLEKWQHVADANGGLSLTGVEHAVARSLKAGLCAAARAELAQLGEVDLESEDGAYKMALEKLLVLTDIPEQM